jgi:biopolymer transport protein ExbB
LRDRNCRQLDDCGAQTWFQGFKHLLPPPGSVAFGVAILENNVLATATLPRDLSPWGMFVNADSVVKAVLIGLAFASLVTWTVWLAKTIEIVICKRRVRAALNILASVRSTSEGVERLAGAEGEVRQFLDAAVTELKLSAGSIERDGIKERIASRLERIEAAYGRRLLRGTGVLATIGSTAPFVGLFGTVWGIMNSFIGISKSHTTNLAVVARVFQNGQRTRRD